MAAINVYQVNITRQEPVIRSTGNFWWTTNVDLSWRRMNIRKCNGPSHQRARHRQHTAAFNLAALKLLPQWGGLQCNNVRFANIAWPDMAKELTACWMVGGYVGVMSDSMSELEWMGHLNNHTNYALLLHWLHSANSLVRPKFSAMGLWPEKRILGHSPQPWTDLQEPL